MFSFTGITRLLKIILSFIRIILHCYGMLLSHVSIRPDHTGSRRTDISEHAVV